MKTAIVLYRAPGTPMDHPGRVTVEKATHSGAQLGLRGDWLVATTLHGDVAFYPRESVVRAWMEIDDS